MSLLSLASSHLPLFELTENPTHVDIRNKHASAHSSTESASSITTPDRDLVRGAPSSKLKRAPSAQTSNELVELEVEVVVVVELDVLVVVVVDVVVLLDLEVLELDVLSVLLLLLVDVVRHSSRVAKYSWPARKRIDPSASSVRWHTFAPSFVSLKENPLHRGACSRHTVAHSSSSKFPLRISIAFSGITCVSGSGNPKFKSAPPGHGRRTNEVEVDELVVELENDILELDVLVLVDVVDRQSSRCKKKLFLLLLSIDGNALEEVSRQTAVRAL